jgi:KaiC/GvpD/RAD55 family RecA-like ATPase
MTNPMPHPRFVPSGIPALDEVVRGIRLGDNVVWQVDQLDTYHTVVDPFVAQSLKDGRRLVYVRFAPHEEVVARDQRIVRYELDPTPGFDQFSRAVHELIEHEGRGVMYVFDSISSLAEEWATDEMLANFFQVTCPFLFQLDTVAYFALDRSRHEAAAVARIRQTTQLLLDTFSVGRDRYVHPLKVAERYGPQMFLPHLAHGDHWAPVLQSGLAAAAAAQAGRHALRRAGASLAPWDSVQQRLLPHRDLDIAAVDADPELRVLKREFIRMMLGDQGALNELADRHMPLGALFDIRDRLIGSGQIGGKAAGMLAARAILTHGDGAATIAPFLESHDSFFIGSDVFFTFLVMNDLFRLRLQVSRQASLSREEFADVERRFLDGVFPDEVMEQFQNLLDYFGQAPIIVRSSSLLEDSVGNAFAGKYHSEFCPNQGTPEERTLAFLNAVKRVYASALNPDALSYRRRRGLIERDEQMAILVQRVSGMHYHRYFFPSLAGVAFSRNLYAWTDRIDPAQGIIRLVFGLGTRAVDRVGGDYPRMIAISHPGLRPEIGVRIARYSQHSMDLIDLDAHALETRPVSEVLNPPEYPGLHYFASVLGEGGDLRDPTTPWIEAPARSLVLTFNNLITRTNFVPLLGDMLRRIETAYGQPVDTEFTASVQSDGTVTINLLQCRPLWMPGEGGRVEWPAELPADRVLFRTDRMINGGAVRGLRYLLYIDPRAYAALPDPARKRSLGRVVGRINNLPDVQRERIVMMGPGRWGSSNIDLGVNVGYGDIDSAAVLVELAREEHGHVPEVSYGTHFFQDLVESQIIYFPVYPDDPDSAFNEAFFKSAPNHLAALLPADADAASVIHLIDLERLQPGLRLTAIADPAQRRAVCFVG